MDSKTEHSTSEEHEHFSLPLFLLTVVLTLSGLFGLVWWLAPQVWTTQLSAPLWKGAVVFAVVSMVNCFMEYFFHRYVLHTSALPVLRRLYRQHTLHHALTRIVKRPSRDGRGILFIENKFPIVEPEQGEASFFPWYSLTLFALFLTPLLATLQWLTPSFPWFLAGFLALANSLMLYELLHAINHWAFEKWERLVLHPRWGSFWRPIYGFHVRHHAVIDCNESISGFFGLPVADWLLGTCVIPKTVYAQGEEATPEKFASPQAVALIRWLDRRAEQAVQSRRSAENGATGVAAGLSSRPKTPAFSRGEEIANWVTHGIGAALSVAGLTVLVVFACSRGDAMDVVSFTLFGAALLLLYTASTFYHAWREGRMKQFLRKVGHASIFVLVAGTYTPFFLSGSHSGWGWAAFCAVWALCLGGAVLKIFLGDSFRFTSSVTGIVFGGLLLVAMLPLLQNLSEGGLTLLLAGALCYAVGVVFYALRRMRYHHAIWHLFVIGGSTCHFLAVLLFLLPDAA